MTISNLNGKDSICWNDIKAVMYISERRINGKFFKKYFKKETYLKGILEIR